MSARQLIRISLTGAQANSVAANLCGATDPELALTSEQWEETETKAAPTSSMIFEEAHPSDDQLVGYCIRDLPAAVLQQIDLHINACPDCSQEIQRLTQLSVLWNEESQIQRLENSIRSLANSNDPFNTLLGPIPRLMESIRVSLRTLAPPLGAYADGQDNDSDPVEFPVTEEGRIVETLQGTLQRRNEEYYVLVQPRRAEDRSQFGDRSVRLVLSDTEKPTPIIQRVVDVGVVVLLGTALPLTDTCQISAQLLPLNSP